MSRHPGDSLWLFTARPGFMRLATGRLDAGVLALRFKAG